MTPKKFDWKKYGTLATKIERQESFHIGQTR